MRIIVLFDLPTTTSADLKSYRTFRKFLLRMGFLMMQESVYSKIALTKTIADSLIFKIWENRPQRGLVQILTVTEKQYANMLTIVGEIKTDTINSDERFIVL